MSIGCGIYFTPVDRSWIGTPNFVRQVAAMFGVARFERFCVWQAFPDPAGNPWNVHRLASKLANVSVEDAIAELRADHEWSSVINVADYIGLLIAMADTVITNGPDSITGGFMPLDVSVRVGEWEVHNQGGDLVGAGMCCVELYNLLGYPARMQEYLQLFLAVPEVIRFKTRLEKFSDQPWEAFIELI